MRVEVHRPTPDDVQVITATKGWKIEKKRVKRKHWATVN